MFGWGKRTPKHPLDRTLFSWSERDPFRVRDLLNGGALILGRAGSGKTSSSGRTLMQSIVDNAQFRRLDPRRPSRRTRTTCGRCSARRRRLDDLMVFDAEGPWRFNFLDYVGKGQTRNVVQCLMMIGQTLKRGEGKGGKDDGQFWEALNERLLYNDVGALQAAGEPVAANASCVSS